MPLMQALVDPMSVNEASWVEPKFECVTMLKKLFKDRSSWKNENELKSHKSTIAIIGRVELKLSYMNNWNYCESTIEIIWRILLKLWKEKCRSWDSNQQPSDNVKWVGKGGIDKSTMSHTLNGSHHSNQAPRVVSIFVVVTDFRLNWSVCIH